MYLHCSTILALFIGTAQLSYCHEAGVRHPSVRPKTSFSRTPSSGLTPNFVDKGLSTVHSISRSILFYFHFFIFYNCFFFHMGEKNSIDISESTHRIHSPKIMHTPRQGLYQSCSIFRSIFDFFFLFVFVNIWPYGGKTFKRHLVWTNTHLLHKIRAYSWGGSQPKMLK